MKTNTNKSAFAAITATGMFLAFAPLSIGAFVYDGFDSSLAGTGTDYTADISMIDQNEARTGFAGTAWQGVGGIERHNHFGECLFAGKQSYIYRDKRRK